MPANSYITFGRRPVFVNSPNTGRWHNHIPLLGHDHWMFASNTKKLNGKEYKYSSGTAELDTGEFRTTLLNILTDSFLVGDRRRILLRGR
jgi:hypothetical protein